LDWSGLEWIGLGGLREVGRENGRIRIGFGVGLGLDLELELEWIGVGGEKM
jgi:hypothetical protein